jgi:ABC-2 type transport system permease protein
MLSRETIRIKNSPSSIIGNILQASILWLIIGSGFSDTFKIQGSNSITYLSFFYPGILLMIILFNSISSTITIIEDRQSGFLQGILVGPGSRTSLAIGKLVATSMTSLLQSVLFFPLIFITEINTIQINFCTTIIIILLASFSLSSMSFIMAWICESSSSYHALMSIILIPLWVLSGSMFPANNGWISKIVVINPIAWITASLRATLNDGIAPLGSINKSLAFNTSFTLLLIFTFIIIIIAIITCNKLR